MSSELAEITRSYVEICVSQQDLPEDSRVECKSKWPTDEAHKTARQIAGLLNAAPGDKAFLIVGLDSKRGVLGADPNELDSWWRGIQKFFDRPTPEMMESHTECLNGKFVVGVQFDCRYRPYVVTLKQSSTERDVPWREGTGTRSANRDQILRAVHGGNSDYILDSFDGSIMIFSDRSLRERIGIAGERGNYAEIVARLMAGKEFPLQRRYFRAQISAAPEGSVSTTRDPVISSETIATSKRGLSRTGHYETWIETDIVTPGLFQITCRFPYSSSELRAKPILEITLGTVLPERGQRNWVLQFKEDPRLTNDPAGNRRWVFQSSRALF